MDSRENHKPHDEPHAEIKAKKEKPMEAFMEQVYDVGDACYSKTSSCSIDPCIFRTPFPGFQFQEPKLASIGPYHYGKTLPLQKYKYSFLHSFLSRAKSQGKDLRFFVRQMMTLERRIRRCYSEEVSASSPEFVETMLLDGCFVLEVLERFGGGSEDWVFPIEPWQLPVLVQDLLILENQIPFFVLEMLFESLKSQGQEGSPTVSLCAMALKVFDLAFPRSMDASCEFDHLEPRHLLDLFLQSIRSPDPSHFHMKKADVFPPFAMALKVFDLVLPKFVYTLLKKTDTRNEADVSKKTDNVTNPKLKVFSHIDPKVVEYFHLLWMNISYLDVQHSYVSERLKELECYYKRCGSFVLRYWRTLFFWITNMLFAFNRLRSGVNLMIHLVQQDFEGGIICAQYHSSFICDSVNCIARFIYNRTRGVDSSLGKFTAFFFLIVVMVIIMFKVFEFPTPTLTVDEQVIEGENSVTTDEQVEDSVMINEQHVEAVSGERGNEMIVDSVNKDTTEECFNGPWRGILEHEVVRMLVSAISILNGIYILVFFFIIII